MQHEISIIQVNSIHVIKSEPNEGRISTRADYEVILELPSFAVEAEVDARVGFLGCHLAIRRILGFGVVSREVVAPPRQFQLPQNRWIRIRSEQLQAEYAVSSCLLRFIRLRLSRLDR